jgi:1-phosphatidylinositol-3-phosphate 5-kinase
MSSSIYSTTIPVTGSVQGPANVRLTGVEKTGLGSVLGWEGREIRGRGMAGIRGFVRHQGLVILYAEYTQTGEETHPCGRPRWVAYRYWSRNPAADADRDQTLGEFVEHSCDLAAMEEHCETEGCQIPRGRHGMSWTCGGVRVSATIKDDADLPDGGDDVEMWQTCAICGKMTTHAKMDSGT